MPPLPPRNGKVHLAVARLEKDVGPGPSLQRDCAVVGPDVQLAGRVDEVLVEPFGCHVLVALQGTAEQGYR